MQKTILANYTSFLVWYGLEKGVTYAGCDLYRVVNDHFPANFGMVTRYRTTG